MTARCLLPPGPVSRPAVRYPGGKWRLASWIMSHFPSHDCYVEPFAGAASVLLQKPPVPYEVYNDLDGMVVNFFRVLRERPDELIRAIELTPWSREEFELAARPSEDPLDQARRFYVRCYQGHSGGGNAKWRVGWRYQRRVSSNKPAVLTWCETDHLWSIVARLKRVQIEHDEAANVIRHFDSPATLFYVDPPYAHSTRSKWKGVMYQHEMSDEDHRSLAELLRSVSGLVAVSGYPSALYDDLYAGWQKAQTTAVTNFSTVKTECLWLSPRTAEALDRERGQGFQLGMFLDGAE